MKFARLGVAAALCAAATLAVPATPAHADATRDKQWYLRSLDVAEAHKYSQGEGVTVAVIDTGVDANHPDLRGNVLDGIETTPGSHGGNGHRDDVGHGTAMAGVIAAHGHGSGAGVLGIAPKAKILPIRDADSRGHGSDAGVAAGIDWAIAHGAKVINYSFGGSTTPKEKAAVARARAADIVVVVAAGNTDRDLLALDALEGVVVAGGTDRKGNHAAISVTGSDVVLSAPAVDITSTAPGGGYHTGAGTSYSTAVLSGAVALVRAKYPDLSADEVIHRLTATATDKGTPGLDNQYGYGVLNLVAALTADVEPAGQASAAAGTPPASSPPTTAAAAPPLEPESDGPLLIVVRVLLVLLVVLIIAGATWFVVRRRRRAS